MSPRLPDSFYALGVRSDLAAALSARGIVAPFEIQAASLPDSLAGRDVLGRGRTGSGKTVAFALPVIERVLSAEGKRRPHRPRALILVPTRELAVQVAETVDYLAKSVRLRTMTIFGGVRYTGQLRKLERGVDVVVATPGRLEDLIAQGAMKLDDIAVVVLDEADLMADMGFLPPVTRVLEAMPAGQRLLFSATLDNDVSKLVDKFLTDPLVHSVDADESAPAAEHYVFGVTHDNKPEVLRELLRGGGRTLAFTRTKHAAERLAQQLTEEGIPAAELHGNLRQAARQRNLSAFADGTVSVLVATDIAARGIHVDNVGLVVHIDPPNDPKAFLHRSGRTARAGGEGNVVTLATRNQNKSVRALMAQAKIKATQKNVTPGDPILTEVRAAQVEPASTGSSIFEPDPEDTVEESEERFDGGREQRSGFGRDQRPDRARRDRDDRAWGRGPRPDRGRGDRFGDRDRSRSFGDRDRPQRSFGDRDDRPRRWDSDERPNRGGDRPWRGDSDQGRGGVVEYRPRREPKEHTSGARGPRPDRGEVAARRERMHAERGNRRPPAEFSSQWWGPEPWEVEDDAPRRSAPSRGGFAGGRDGGRPRTPSGGRDDRRPRPGRDARRERQDAGRQESWGRPAREDSWGRGPREDSRERGPRQDSWGRGPREDARDRGPRSDRGPRPDRGQRRDGDGGARAERPARKDGPVGEAEAPRAKARWTAEDRRKAAESSARGFGYTKSGPKGAAKHKSRKPSAGKDKGKRKPR